MASESLELKVVGVIGFGLHLPGPLKRLKQKAQTHERTIVFTYFFGLQLGCFRV